jgi:hypothetical protein
VRFEAACTEIAAALTDFGFRYSKSKREAKKIIGEWTQAVSFQSSFRNTADDVRLWVWYSVGSDTVSRWRRERGAAAVSPHVFRCALGYLGDPATFIDWNVAGDSAPVVQDVVDRVRSGADRISSVIMDVPTFVDRASESDLAFFDPSDVVDLLAAHGCGDQVGSYLRRLSRGLQSTGTVRIDGSVILAAAQSYLSNEDLPQSSWGAARLIDALDRADSAHLIAELAS